MIDTLLTLQEAAALLEVHPRTVKRLLGDGKINGCSFAGKRKVYFLKAHLEERKPFVLDPRGRHPKARPAGPG